LHDLACLRTGFIGDKFCDEGTIDFSGGVEGIGLDCEFSVTVFLIVVTVAAVAAVSIAILDGRLPLPPQFPFLKRALRLAKSSSNVAIFF
jgi:hypothetical protein